MPTIPTDIPSQLTIGDFFAWTKVFNGYPSADFTLTYYFNQIIAGTPAAFSLEAEDQGDGVTFEIGKDSSEIEGIVAGNYRVSARITDDGDTSRIVETVDVEILPDPASGNPDVRTQAEIMLAALDAALLSQATSNQLKYSVDTPNGSRSIEKMDGNELLKWRNYYKALVEAEKAKREGRQGGNINVEFERP